jgi:hypothetical protein
MRVVVRNLSGSNTSRLAVQAARGRKRHAKSDKTDCRHLRMLLAEGRLPECWIPPGGRRSGPGRSR